MVSPLDTTNSGALNSATGSGGVTSDLASIAGQNQALGKDAFLKLLVAQMKNQDPLKPMDDTAFVAQLAQFSSLEQQTSTNQLLQLMSTQQQGLANNTIVDLVGKNISLKGNTVSYDGSGLGATTRFTLAAPANNVTITITDSSGKAIRTMQAGAKPAGIGSVQWDGKDDVGTTQPSGTYSVSVSATTADGSAVVVNQETTGTVTGVSFDQGFTQLILDNGVTAPASDLIRVNK
jgi:flagellar basal-body rod modification protein FlgD